MDQDDSTDRDEKKWAIFESIALAGGLAVIIMFAAKGGFWQNLGLGALIFAAVGALALVAVAPILAEDENETSEENARAGRIRPDWRLIQAASVGVFAAGFVMLGAKGDLWRVLGIGACVFVAAGALSLINSSWKMSPAQHRWRKALYPDMAETSEEPAEVARRHVELATASSQERRLNRVGVALVIGAIALLYLAAQRFF